MKEPDYDFADVPRAAKDLSGSCIQRLSCRNDALPCLPEMVLLCNEAARRGAERSRGGAHSSGGKPLALEYLADRIDTDDPLHGYTVRTREQVRIGLLRLLLLLAKGYRGSLPQSYCNTPTISAGLDAGLRYCHHFYHLGAVVSMGVTC
jgi:hypothetical protein